MRRTVWLTIVLTLSILVPLPSSAASAVGLYRAAGLIKTSLPGQGDLVLGSATLSVVGTPDRVPARGTLTLRVHPLVARLEPVMCFSVLSTGTMTVTWGDGSRSRGPVRLSVTPEATSLTVHASIASGRFAGGTIVLAGTGVPPNPCRLPFSGVAVLFDRT